jgi:hypothetical protein
VILDDEYAHAASIPRTGDTWVTASVTGVSPDAGYNGAMRTPTPMIVIPLLLAAALAGCGSSPTGNASGGSPNSSFASLKAAAYKQSACMRAHGVPNFPDPKASENGNHIQVVVSVAGLDPSSPQFKHAQAACAYLMPAGNVQNGPSAAQQQARLQGLIAFIRCLRTHGFPSFPDPDSQGQLSLTAVTKAGINFHQPGLLTAADTCVGDSHGSVTKADVAQAVQGDAASGSHTSAGAGQ